MDKVKTQTIKKKEVVDELKNVIRQNYVLLIDEAQDGIILRYLNGQKFLLRVEEVF